MSKKGTVKVTIHAGAAEKVSMADFETCQRESHISLEFELPVSLEEGRIDFGPGFEHQIKSLQQGAQMAVESQVYSALARAFSTRRFQPRDFEHYTRAASDRTHRASAIIETGSPEQLETLCLDAAALPPKSNAAPFAKAA